MIDSDGKIGSGILQGNTLWLGRYSECKDKEVLTNSNGTSFFVINLSLQAGREEVSCKWGSCFPESCSTKDVDIITNNTITDINTFLANHNLTGVKFSFQETVNVDQSNMFLHDDASTWRVLILAFCILFVLLMSTLDFLQEHAMDTNEAILEVKGNGVVEEEHPERVKNQDEMVQTTSVVVDSTDVSDENKKTIESRWPNTRNIALFLVENQEINKEVAGVVNLEKKDEPSKNKSKSTVTLFAIAKAFSIKRNLYKIFSIHGSSEGDLDCLHGLRFLSMTWVILGHTFYFSLPFLDNPLWASDQIKNSLSMEAVEQV